ncbi:MAG TPA: hypothetical protein VGE07_16120, partial [Herpetosiphonaceae bacterium]
LLGLGGLGVPRLRAQPPAWLLADLVPGPLDSYPAAFRPHGGLTFFIADTSSLYELWRTDGTAEGTLRIHAQHSVRILAMASAGERFLFVRGPAERPTFWQTDGTVSGTSALSTLALPAGYAMAGGLIRFQNAFLFLAVRQPEAGGGAWDVQLWRLADLAAPPALVTSLADQGSFSWYFIGPTHAMGDRLYIWDEAHSGTQGVPPRYRSDHRLLVFDGQTLSVRARCSRLTSEAEPPCGHLFGDETAAFYTADGLLHRETAADHTTLDLTGLGIGTQTHFARLGQHILVAGVDAANQAGLWRMGDTLTDTQRLLTAGDPMRAVTVNPPVAVHGRVYLSTWHGDGTSVLWQSDGTVSGTRSVPLPGRLGAIGAVGSTLILNLTAPDTGSEIWSMAAPDQPPQLVADLWPGPTSSRSDNDLRVAQAGNGLLFGADDGVHGDEPRWVPFAQPPLTAGWAGAGPGRAATIPVRLGPGLAAPQPLTLTLTLPPELTLLDHSLEITPTISGGTAQWQISGLAARTQHVRLTVGMPAAALGATYTATLSVAPYGVTVPIRLSIAHEHALPLLSRPPAR